MATPEEIEKLKKAYLAANPPATPIPLGTDPSLELAGGIPPIVMPATPVPGSDDALLFEKTGIAPNDIPKELKDIITAKLNKPVLPQKSGTLGPPTAGTAAGSVADLKEEYLTPSSMGGDYVTPSSSGGDYVTPSSITGEKSTAPGSPAVVTAPNGGIISVNGIPYEEYAKNKDFYNALWAKQKAEADKKLDPAKLKSAIGGGGFAAGKIDMEQFLSPADRALFAADRDILRAQMGGDAKLMEQKSTDEALRSQYLADVHGELEKRRTDEDAKEAERQAFARAELGKMNDAWEKASKKEIDPNRYWNDKSTFSQIMTGIAVILGGAANAKGMENMQLKQLNDSIDKDIAMQKLQIAKGFESVAVKKGIYADMLKTFGDERQADVASRIHYLESVKTKTEEMAASSSSDMAAIGATKITNTLDALIQKSYAEMEALKQQRYDAFVIARNKANALAAANKEKRDWEVFKSGLEVLKGQAAELSKSSGGAITAKPGMDAKGMPILVNAADGMPIDPEILQKYGIDPGLKDGVKVPLFGGVNALGQPYASGLVTIDKDGAKLIREANDQFGSANKALADIEAFIQKNGYTAWGTVGNAEAKALRSSFLSSVASLTKLSDADREELLKAIPEPGTVFTDANLAKVAIQKKVLKNKYDSVVEAVVPGAAKAKPNEKAK